MSSHQTIVVELGSSCIKVGFAGESKPRRVFSDNGSVNDGNWCANISDSLISRACQWRTLFRYLSSRSVTDFDGPATTATTVYEWEKTLYPLFSHMLTSVLFVQRASRHRIVLLINDFFPPLNFREALHRVLLDYLALGGVWLANGGVFESVYYLIEGLPLKLSSFGRPKAHLLLDIGTYEGRAIVSVIGSSILEDTHQSTMSGYRSFLHQVLTNYEGANSDDKKTGMTRQISTMEDADAVVKAWIAFRAHSSDITSDTTTFPVKLPCFEQQKPETISEAVVHLLPQPLMQAFNKIYLDYTNPSSLIFAMLRCAISCPIDYRKAALENVILLGGGSVALRHFSVLGDLDSEENAENNGLALRLEMAAKEACGVSEAGSIDLGIHEEEKEKELSDVSSIAKYRFQSLKKSIGGPGNADGEGRGVNIQYPDPFAANMAAWIGGSIMGALALKRYEKKI